jgi:hypothetical protein
MRPTVLLHDSQENLVHHRRAVRDCGSRALGYRATSSGGTSDFGSGHPMEPDAVDDHPCTRAQPANVHPARNLATMTSVKYIAALQEVQRQGEVHSAARAADQTRSPTSGPRRSRTTGMRSHRRQRSTFSPYPPVP